MMPTCYLVELSFIIEMISNDKLNTVNSLPKRNRIKEYFGIFESRK